MHTCRFHSRFALFDGTEFLWSRCVSVFWGIQASNWHTWLMLAALFKISCHFSFFCFFFVFPATMLLFSALDCVELIVSHCIYTNTVCDSMSSNILYQNYSRFNVWTPEPEDAQDRGMENLHSPIFTMPWFVSSQQDCKRNILKVLLCFGEK